MSLSMAADQPENKLRLLCVDDEERVLSALRRCFRRQAANIFLATSGQEALELLERESDIQVVISDYRMPGMNGVDFLDQVRLHWPRIQRVMLTGYADQQAIEEAINRSEIHRFVTKPWSDGHLRSVVMTAFDHYELIDTNENLYDQLRVQNVALEAKVAERTRELAAAADEWERSVDAIVDPLVIIQPDYGIRRMNRALADRAGLQVTEVPGRRCYSMMFGREQPCDHCQAHHLFEGGGPRTWQCEGNDATYRVSAYRMAKTEGLPQRVVLTYRDVSEEERINRRLATAQRMLELGGLAGGVAHEINNPLAGILAFTQMMQLDEGRTKDDLDQLTQIEKATRRCMRIVDGLLHFSRAPQDSRSELISPKELVANLDGILEPLAATVDIDLEMEIEETLPTLRGSLGELEQVLVIMITNAAHAVAPAGRIRISMTLGPLGFRLAVDDSGAGVPRELQASIFQPFFTTKPEGKGTGLGLAIAYRIAEAHGGELSVCASEQLGGARFCVDLPAIEEGVLP